jgi:hypothetical protein
VIALEAITLQSHQTRHSGEGATGRPAESMTYRSTCKIAEEKSWMPSFDGMTLKLPTGRKSADGK